MIKHFEDGTWSKIQFIKNHPATMVCRTFRKYNIVEGRYWATKKHWIYYTKFAIHFIPEEYVKIYKH